MNQVFRMQHMVYITFTKVKTDELTRTIKLRNDTFLKRSLKFISAPRMKGIKQVGLYTK
jgi:hypothetical protein